MNRMRWWTKYLVLGGMTLAGPLSMGGCELSCNSNDVEDVVDEVGDEMEDVAEKLKGD